MRATPGTADHLIAARPDADDLFKLLNDAPGVVEELLKRRPHKSALFRWAAKGIAGVRLQCITVGRCRFTTRRMLLEFWAAVDAARRAADETAPAKPRRKNRRRKAGMAR